MHTRGHGEKLSRKREQALAALLTCPTISAAAQTVGISEITLWRWLQQPDFQATYRHARQEAVRYAIARLQQSSSKAVDALETIVADPTTPAAARVQAAKTILEMALRTETADLLERVQALEEILTNEERQTYHARIAT